MGKLLIPYLTAGFPEPSWFAPLLRTLDENGADFIEIGVPFSDPIADGPTIQGASQIALEKGTKLSWILDQVRAVRPSLRSRLIFFSYYNPLASLAPTLAEGAKVLADCGFHGVLVPDLALEQAGELISALRAVDMHYIPLIAPTTTDERLRLIAPHTTSFAYGVSVTGVTGARQGVSSGLDQYLARVRAHFPAFVVGFGISTPEDAARISAQADGVVVGSALVRLVGEAANLDDAQNRVAAFMRALRQAIDQT